MSKKTEPIGVRFAPQVREDLERLGVIMGISVADIIRLAVKEYIDKHIQVEPPVDRIASAVVAQLISMGAINIPAQNGTVKEVVDG